MKYTTYFMFVKSNCVSHSGGKYYIEILDKMLIRYMGLMLVFIYGIDHEGVGLKWIPQSGI